MSERWLAFPHCVYSQLGRMVLFTEISKTKDAGSLVGLVSQHENQCQILIESRSLQKLENSACNTLVPVITDWFLSEASDAQFHIIRSPLGGESRKDSPAEFTDFPKHQCDQGVPILFPFESQRGANAKGCDTAGFRWHTKVLSRLWGNLRSRCFQVAKSSFLLCRLLFLKEN